MGLVQSLFPGPVDIVGDVHGEIQALRNLLDTLGYSPRGRHPQGRQLVFVGDLTDRGPDSPAVVNLVAELVAKHRAQCVLGNHELNILRQARKGHNDWFFGEHTADDLHYGTLPQLADDVIRTSMLDFFSTLPLALERPDLRVVHACWCDTALSCLRSCRNVLETYRAHKQRIADEITPRHDLDDIDRSLIFQNENPVKLVTSGPEQRLQRNESPDAQPNNQRVPWWTDYSAPQLCVFGHYGLPAHAARRSPRAVCIDFGVGKRRLERRAGKTRDFLWKLAALRFPEEHVVFDNGQQISVRELPG